MGDAEMKCSGLRQKKKKKKEDSGDRLVGKPKDKIFF